MRRPLVLAAMVLPALLYALAAAWPVLADAARFVVGDFSAMSPGPLADGAWTPLAFADRPGPTDYRLVTDGDTTVIAARAAGTASGLIRGLDVDPARWPLLRWRWQLGQLPQGGDMRRRAGDDYAARIYVAFAYDADDVGLFERARFAVLRLRYGHYPPRAVLNYVWATRAPAGTGMPNAYVSRVYMVAVESGAARRGEWVVEQRDLVADFRRAFGYDPPAISGIAIMTDADDTGSVAAARYGDIELLARPVP